MESKWESVWKAIWGVADGENWDWMVEGAPPAAGIKPCRHTGIQVTNLLLKAERWIHANCRAFVQSRDQGKRANSSAWS